MAEYGEREVAIKRVKAKRHLKTQAFVYLVVNGILVLIWAVSGGGYFWPVWSIAFWGMGLAISWWSTYRADRSITEEEIQREMRGRP